MSAIAKCPMCGREVPEEARFKPFCTERCRLLDLGNWLDERYVVPAKLDDESAPVPAAPGRDEPDPN